jgi:hypothetical protein
VFSGSIGRHRRVAFVFALLRAAVNKTQSQLDSCDVMQRITNERSTSDRQQRAQQSRGREDVDVVLNLMVLVLILSARASVDDSLNEFSSRSGLALFASMKPINDTINHREGDEQGDGLTLIDVSLLVRHLRRLV